MMLHFHSSLDNYEKARDISHVLSTGHLYFSSSSHSLHFTHSFDTSSKLSQTTFFTDSSIITLSLYKLSVPSLAFKSIMSRPLASWSILGKRQKANDLDDDDFVDDSFAQDSDFADDGDLDDDDDVVFIKEEHKDEDIEDDGINFEADIDENIDLDAQYNERMEELPKLPAYHPDLPKITASLTGTIQEVLNIIEANPCDSTHVQGIKTKGQGLLEIPKPKPVRIALLGDTGAGKSSLLNSIIDIPDLARALGSGESCTYVATEYETAFQQQQKRFAAEVQYFDMESIDTMLKEHVDSYVGFTFHPDSHWVRIGGSSPSHFSERRRANASKLLTAGPRHSHAIQAQIGHGHQDLLCLVLPEAGIQITACRGEVSQHEEG